VVGLVLFAGLMSGLTLGLMSLSLVDLEVLQKSGTPPDRKHAGMVSQIELMILFHSSQFNDLRCGTCSYDLPYNDQCCGVDFQEKYSLW
jgi:hypothetical protein